VFFLVAFWLSVAVLAYGYAGFPLLVAGVARIRNRQVLKAAITPHVSLIIAAYNEEKVVGRRVENALALDYPPELLEVIVASDGSTDGTEAALAGLDPDRVRVLRLPRRGKAHALAEAVRRSRGEILVFSDANTHYDPGALRALVRNFADPEVGGVAGHTGYVLPPDGEAAGRGEDLYWRYDTWLKALESRTGSVISAHGGMYALRRELFRPLEDASVTDDFGISTGVVEQGSRLVFEPEARGYETTVGQSSGEFGRRVRLMTRGLRGVVLRRRLLNPARYGFYSVSFFSHKILRRLLPLFLPVLFVTSVALSSQGLLYLGAAWAQGVFYGLALIGWALRDRSLGMRRPFYIPFFYCLANLAAVVALWNLVRGKRIERWSPQRHEGQPRAGQGRPAAALNGAPDRLAGRPSRAATMELSAAGLPCCVLQRAEEEGFLGLETIPLLIEPENAPALEEKLLGKGFLLMPLDLGGIRSRLVGRAPDGSGWVCVEVRTELLYGKPTPFLSAPEDVKRMIRKRRCGGTVSVLTPDADFVDLLLHALLDRERISPAVGHQLQALMGALRDRPCLAGRAAERVQLELAPAITWDGLVRDVTEGNWDALLRRRRSLAVRMARSAPLATLVRLGTGWRRRAGEYLGLLGAARSPGLVVALLAGDGGGKSAVARGLTREIPLPSRAIYGGYPRDLPRPVPGVRGLHRMTSFWSRAVAVRWLRSRGKVVIADRYVYDGWIADGGADPGRRSWRRRILEWPFPTPDLVVILDAPGALLHQRSRELTPALLEDKRAAYLALGARIPGAVILDATRPEEEVLAEAMGHVWSACRRNMARRRWSA
jgi:glycosyltransferase involved in cell wall biosynthesis